MSILILCHPKIINIKDNKITNHWYSDIILEIFNKYNIDINLIKFDTVDILNGGTIVDDCFSKSFQMKNLEKYDMIILPDCAGDWYHLQEAHDEKNFELLLIGIMSMMKSNSAILIDKFIYNEFRNLTIKVLIEKDFKIILDFNCKLFGKKYDNFIFARKFV